MPVIQPRDVHRVEESFTPKGLGALDAHHKGGHEGELKSAAQHQPAWIRAYLQLSNHSPSVLSSHADASPSNASRKQAATKERTFQRVVAMHAAAAEAGNFTGRIKPRNRLA